MFIYFFLFIILALILIKYLLFQMEKYYLFHPTKIKHYESTNFNEQVIIKQQPLRFYEFFIKTLNPNPLNLLFLKNSNTKNLIIYAHGNAGNISDCLHLFQKLHKFSSIIMFDYRGYGKSKGIPTESGLYEDIKSVWIFVVDYLKINPKYISLYGESLGTALVTWLGAFLCEKNQLPNSIIFQSGFSNLKNLTQDHFNYFLSFCLTYQFDNCQHIKNISNRIPILISHSPEDKLINIKHVSIILKETKVTNIKFYQLSGPHHNPENLNNPNYIKIIRSFLYEN